MKKYKLQKFKDINTYDYSWFAREMTEEELYIVNGGSTVEDTHTVQSGDTLGTLVYNYNQANGTNLTVNEVAASNGIEDPNLIYVGQTINFGNSGGDTTTSNSETGNTLTDTGGDVSQQQQGHITSSGATQTSGGATQTSGTKPSAAVTDTSVSNNINDTGWYFNPQNSTNIVVDLDNLQALDQVLNILSDPYLGYTVTGQHSESGKDMTFENYGELLSYMLYGDINDTDLNGSEVYFIYTYEKSDVLMKAFERSSIDDDLIYLKKKGISVRVIESGTKADILNAFSDPKARLIVTSGHGSRWNKGICTSDGAVLSFRDLKNYSIGKSLKTVIFENCYQGEFEKEWENAFGGNVDVVGWIGTTNSIETRLFNGSGAFDRQSYNLRDYIDNILFDGSQMDDSNIIN